MRTFITGLALLALGILVPVLIGLAGGSVAEKPVFWLLSALFVVSGVVVAIVGAVLWGTGRSRTRA